MDEEDSKLHRNFVGSIIYTSYIYHMYIPLSPLKRKCILEECNSILILEYSGIWELTLINAGNSVLVLIICRQVKAVNFLSAKPMIYWK